MKQVTLYTDGSCLSNPGPGGYGAILRFGPHEKELSRGYVMTTNNRMELRAVIEGLRALRESCLVTVVTDSQYVRNGMTSWVKAWQARGWKTSARQPVKNRDLWQDLIAECARHEVHWQWVKGHAGHPENERCDELARTAATEAPVTPDVGFDD